MGLIARILDSFQGKDKEPGATVERYKGDNATARIFNPSGDDSRPLDQDVCFTENSEDTEGGKDVLGFIDPLNPPVSEKGEKRFYSRDEDGNIVGTVYLKKDGTLQIDLDKDLIQNIAGEINQTITGNVILEAPKFSFGDGTNELISEAIKGFKELKKTLGNTILGGGNTVDSPGVSSTGTLSVITAPLAAAEAAVDLVITALETLQV